MERTTTGTHAGMLASCETAGHAQAEEQCRELAANLLRGRFSIEEVCSAACGGTGSSQPQQPRTGKLLFWTDASRGWKAIEIRVDGQYEGTLRAYLDEAPASCDYESDSRVIVERRPGRYTVTLKESYGRTTWPPYEVTVRAGMCAGTESIAVPTGTAGRVAG